MIIAVENSRRMARAAVATSLTRTSEYASCTLRWRSARSSAWAASGAGRVLASAASPPAPPHLMRRATLLAGACHRNAYELRAVQASPRCRLTLGRIAVSLAGSRKR